MPDLDLTAPVTGDESEDEGVEDGVALCLSGGGYRAMLFHLGALWSLNASGYLPRLRRVSAVSGGSITAGVLGVAWRDLGFSSDGVAVDFGRKVVEPVRRMAGQTIDRGAIVGGILLPGSISSRIASKYDEFLFRGKTLQDLPSDDDGPRFVLNAANLHSGVLWRFSRPYMADYRMGRVMQPDVALAQAVAASSAFPPVLSPAVLKVDPARYDAESRTWELASLQSRGRVDLSDGGVYDNLGMETAWKRYKTILISDGGGTLSPEASIARDWARHSIRVLKVIDNQVRSLRKRQAIGAFERGDRLGTYWGIRSDPRDFGLPDPLPSDPSLVSPLAAVPTRLKRLKPSDQERLINWGFVICDTAMRRWVDPSLPRPDEIPYPSSPIG